MQQVWPRSAVSYCSLCRFFSKPKEKFEVLVFYDAKQPGANFRTFDAKSSRTGLSTDDTLSLA